jgi:general stress protein 26
LAQLYFRIIKNIIMGDTKNLGSTEAVKKIMDLGEDIKTCMFCSFGAGRLKSRPMSAQQIDEDGNIWFLSDKNSDKNREIKIDNKVDLIFNGGNDKFLSIHGTAEISFDKEKIKELWQPIVKIWFKQGVDDPNISVIKVSYVDGYYWDTKHGKMLAMAKMAYSLMSGKTMDDGIEGSLKK